SLTHTSRLSPSPLNLTFTPLNWNIAQTVTVSAVDDGLYQGLTSGLITHTTTSTDPDYSGIATAGVTVSILDDEVQPSVQFSTATSAADENSGPVNLTLTLAPNPSTQDVTVSYAVTGTATAGVDFSLSGGTAIIRAGDTMTNIILAVLDDFYNEPDEVVTVTLSAPGNASLGTPVTRTHTILDDDTPGVSVTQTGGSTDVAEGGPTDTYQVVLTSRPTGPVTVTVTTDAQTGASPGSLTFDGLTWNTVQTVTVSAVDDAVYESNHTGQITHTVTSTDSDYHGIAAAGVTVNITDNESPPQLAVDDVTVDEAAGTAAVTVTLTGQSSFPASVEYTVGGGTATGGGVDYSAVNGSLSWLAGETGGKSFTITVVDDALDEPDETANVSLSNPTGAAISDGSGLLTITDNDLPPMLVITKTVSTASTPARHGETVTYTIVVANQSATDAPDVSVVDNLPAGVSGTNLNQTVYISASQRLTFTLTASVAGSAPYGGSITNIASFSHVSGSGQDSAVFTVEPDTAPPAIPTLITPTGGIALANLRPTFDWDDVVDGETGVVSYTLTLTHTGVSTGYTVTESTFTPAADLAEGDYTWTVQAFDAAGNGGPSSAEGSFRLSIPKYIFLPIVIK
ncbi:MAG: DUF11 domain-containing protein, partial [Chloroflexi bacterium]